MSNKKDIFYVAQEAVRFTGFALRNIGRYLATARVAVARAMSALKTKAEKLSGRNSPASLDRKLLSKLHGRTRPTFSQLKHLNKVLDPREKKIMRFLAGGLFLGCLLFIYGYFFVGGVQRPDYGGSYTEALIGNALYINPVLAKSETDSDIVRVMFNGLVRYDSNFQPIPDLAESWKISDDGKIYTFKLRKDIVWHDGIPLTANDVLFTFQTIQNEKFKSPLFLSFQGVKVEITGEDTVSFTLPQPYVGFIHNLTVGIIPQHIWISVPAENFQLSPYNQKPVGTGPFKFQSATQEKNGVISSIVMTANPRYHLGRPFLDTIQFKMYGDSKSALEALKNTNVQGMSYLPKDYLAEASKHNIALKAINSSQFTAVFFNPNTQALFKDGTVRQALSMAVNKSRLVSEVLLGQGRDIHSAILPGYPGYDSSLVDEYNPVKAAEILTADGWAIKPFTLKKTDAEGNETEVTEDVLVKKDTPMNITLTTIDEPDSAKLVKYIKDDWAQIGVHVEIQLIDRNTFIKETLKDRKYEALAYGGIVGYDADPFYFWHSSQREYPGVNLAEYVNRKVDALIEEARTLPKEEDRTADYAQIAKMIASDIPAIFLYSPIYSYPVSTDIKGIEINRINLPSDRFWNIHQWYEKTKHSRK